MEERKIQDVIETLRHAKARPQRCTLLIGAGCSVTARIPTAPGIVDYVAKEFPQKYSRARQKTYPHVMARLYLRERREVIAHFVDKAKINWAHVCIAQLMEQGFVDRILTTNFDPLVIRACSLLRVFPAVYDFGASKLFKPADVAEKAVFYLHGQHTGFALLNTKEECGELTDRLGSVLEDTGRGRPWIVVGYSGENDPVFEQLSGIPRFDSGLYWVGYEGGPTEAVREGLLDADKDACFVRGYNADSFFIALAQRLGIFPPAFVNRPFSYLDACLDSLAPFPMGKSEEHKEERDVTTEPRRWIAEAIATYERGEGKAVAARELLMAGKYSEVEELSSGPDEPTPELADPLSWAYVMQANALSRQADGALPEDGLPLISLACAKYASAIKLKPDMYQAFTNWGVALQIRGQLTRGNERDEAFAEAIEKHKAAFELDPNHYSNLNNWAVTLIRQTRYKREAEGRKLLSKARGKLELALKISPYLPEALLNLAIVLVEQAKIEDDPDNLLVEAYTHLKAALAINPGLQKAYITWGKSLTHQATLKSGEEADALFRQAHDKLELAQALNPSEPDVLNAMATALLLQAQKKPPVTASDLRAKATQKAMAAESLRRGAGAYNMGCISALAGEEAQCRKWLEQGDRLGEFPNRDHIASDLDLEAVRDRPWFREFLAAL